MGRNFYLLENSGLVEDSEEYDLSLKYSLGRYTRATVKHNLYQDQLPQRDIVSRSNKGSMGLSLFFPQLPSLSLTYGVIKSLSTLSMTKRRYIKSRLKYTIIPGKRTSFVKYAINKKTSEKTGGYNKIATTLDMSYYFAKKGSLSIQYTVQSNPNLASNSGSSSGSRRVELSYTNRLTKNHHLSLRCSLMSRRSSSKNNPQKQDIRLTYSYKF